MIRQALSLASAEKKVETAFVVGAPPEGEIPAPCFVAPGLDYDDFGSASAGQLAAGRSDAGRPAAGAETLAKSIEAALARAFPGGCDVIHVHNPLIRKNARLLGALRLLQERGYALLVQVHDLAEDFRLEVYDGTSPYPEGCDYAAINGRDRDRLVASGLHPDHVHLLPNPVAYHVGFDPRKGYSIEASRSRRSALYPVRAIGRKNIGEALLLSLFLPKGADLSITLPPTNPRDDRAHGAWKELSVSLRLPVRFEAGIGRSLAELYDASFCAVTTSVKEGFGYTYLDPLVRGLPVAGREIPHIVADFAEKGLLFDNLYRRIEIPRSAVSAGALRSESAKRITAFRRAYAPAFGKEVGRLETLLAELHGRFEGDLVDFGALDTCLQASLLRSMGADDGFASEIETLNPFLEKLFRDAPDAAEAKSRREAVLTGYSEEDYGLRLFEVYRTAADRRASGTIDKARLIESYLEPSSFFLCAS